MAEFHPDQRCVCGHAGRDHRPSAVAEFGRGRCIPSGCGCRLMVIPGITPFPRPRYLHHREARFGLVVHRLKRKGSGEYKSPELIEAVPTVSADVAWAVGNTLVEPTDGRRPPFVYVDWLGGPVHGASGDMVRISPCGCGKPVHVFGKPAEVAELGPVLRWVKEHTTSSDWCELVPVELAGEERT